MNSSLTETEREVRKFEKKARQKEQRYNETKDDKFLRERDNFKDRAQKARERDTLSPKKATTNILRKTDDQLLNEAIRQARRERNDATKARKLQEKVEEKIIQNRISTKEMIQKKKKELLSAQKDADEERDTNSWDVAMEKNAYKKKYLGLNPNASDSQIHRDFIREYKNKRDILEWRDKMINVLMSIGMTETQALEEINKMITKEQHLIEEVGEVAEVPEVAEVAEVPEVEEVPEVGENNTLWCLNECCIESLQTFENEGYLQEHIDYKHQLNETPRL